MWVGAEAARQAHNLEAVGSSPTPATWGVAQLIEQPLTGGSSGRAPGICRYDTGLNPVAPNLKRVPQSGELTNIPIVFSIGSTPIAPTAGVARRH